MQPTRCMINNYSVPCQKDANHDAMRIWRKVDSRFREPAGSIHGPGFALHEQLVCARHAGCWRGGFVQFLPASSVQCSDHRAADIGHFSWLGSCRRSSSASSHRIAGCSAGRRGDCRFVAPVPSFSHGSWGHPRPSRVETIDSGQHKRCI